MHHPTIICPQDHVLKSLATIVLVCLCVQSAENCCNIQYIYIYIHIIII